LDRECEVVHGALLDLLRRPAVRVQAVGEEAGVRHAAVGVHGGHDPQRHRVRDRLRQRAQQDAQPTLLVAVGLAHHHHRSRPVADSHRHDLTTRLGRTDPAHLVDAAVFRDRTVAEV